MRWTFSLFAFVVLVADVTPQIVVPDGFAVDQFAPRLDNATPRLTAISNPAYGSGVITASANNGIVTIRRVSQGNAEVVTVIPGLNAQSFVSRARFDGTGLYQDLLHVSVRDGPFTPGTTVPGRSKMFSIAPNGITQLRWDLGYPESQSFDFDFDFTDGAGGYMPGAYLSDGNAHGGTALARASLSYQVTVLSPNALPPGRTDMDVRGFQFDPTGLYGNKLLAADSDPNHDNITAIYAMMPPSTWQLVGTQVTTQSRFYGDLTISPGGALGQSVYVTDKVTETIMSVAPDGSHTLWASGFFGIDSVSAASDGMSLYVSDFNGVYRIRPIGDEPGPTIVMQEPFVPNNGTLTNQEGVSFCRLIWSSQVLFDAGDFMVINKHAQSVDFSVSGSGSAIMVVAFGETLLNNIYTVTISDSVTGLTGVKIDGDEDGLAGGAAIITLSHRTCQPGAERGDIDGDGDTDLRDFGLFEDFFSGPLP